MLELSTAFFSFFKQPQTFDVGTEAICHGECQIKGFGVFFIETLNSEFTDGLITDLQRKDGCIFFGRFIPVDGSDFL